MSRRRITFPDGDIRKPDDDIPKLYKEYVDNAIKEKTETITKDLVVPLGFMTLFMLDIIYNSGISRKDEITEVMNSELGSDTKFYKTLKRIKARTRDPELRHQLEVFLNLMEMVVTDTALLSDSEVMELVIEEGINYRYNEDD